MGKLKIDVKKLKKRFDFNILRIELFIFCKFFELLDIYITSTYFPLNNNIKTDVFVLLFLFLSIIELNCLQISFFTIFFSYTYFFTFYYSYNYFKDYFLIVAILSALVLGILFTFFLIKSDKELYSNKSFFEADFGSDSYSTISLLLLFLCFFLAIPVIYIFLVIVTNKQGIKYIIKNLKNLKNLKNITKICSALISSGVIGALTPMLLENLIHNYRSISIMDNNGVVIKNSLNQNSSIFYFWFTNDKSSSIQVKFLGWCYGSNIKKINHNQWEISAVNYYNPIYDSIEFEDVKAFEMSTILSFKLDTELKRHIFKTTDNICLIYIDSAGNFYAKKLFFDFIQEPERISYKKKLIRHINHIKKLIVSIIL